MNKWNTRANQVTVSYFGLYLLLLSVLIVSGCSSKKLVSDYEASSYQETQRLAGEVDGFYASLLDVAAKDRQYQQFSEQYNSLETELTALYSNNQSRPDNQESTKISQSILGLWKKYKLSHQSNNIYSDGNANLDRKRFARLFSSAENAESIKKRN